MTQRRHAADLEPRRLLHEIRAGTLDLLAEQRLHLLLVNAVGARCDHQHWLATGAPEQDRLGDLRQVAADGVGCILCGVGTLVEFDDREGGPQRRRHAQRLGVARSPHRCQPRIRLPSGSKGGSVMMVALRLSPMISISKAPSEVSPASSTGT